MSEKSLSVNLAVPMVTGGGVGLVAGYLSAPRKFSLKKLLVQPQDKFEAIFSSDVTEAMTTEEKNSLKSIKKASKEFHKSGEDLQKIIKTASKEWAEKFAAIKIDDSLTQKAQAKKAALQQALKDQTDPRKLKAEYRDARRDIKRARFAAMNQLEDKGCNVKTAYKAMKKAAAEKHTLTSNKLFELTNNDTLKGYYKAIKKFLPRARARSAAAGAVILGTLTTLVSIFFNPSTQNKR